MQIRSAPWIVQNVDNTIDLITVKLTTFTNNKNSNKTKDKTMPFQHRNDWKNPPLILLIYLQLIYPIRLKNV